MQKINLKLLPYLVGGINFCVLIASDIFTPSLPSIGSFFSISENEASKTVTLYLILMASSGLVFGPLSDQIGKRKVAGILASFMIIGSLISVSANNYTQLIIGRAIQGVGASVMTICVAMMRDHIKSNSFSSAMSTVAMMHAIAPVVGPLIGGIIIIYFAWQFNFYVILAVCILVGMLIYLAFPKDEMQTLNNEEIGVKRIIHDYKLLLCNKNYVLFMLIAPLNYGVFWADVSNMPFIIVNSMNYKPIIFSYYIMMGVSFYIIGNMINKRLVMKYSIHKILYWGILLIIIFNILALMIRSQTIINPLIIPLLKAGSTIGMAFVHANTNSLALGSTRNKSGSAVSLVSFCQLAFASAFVWFTTFFFNGTIYPLLITAIVSGFLKLGLYKLTSNNQPSSA
ncbi:MAG: MFS transporter [Rickettsiales bacterium]